MKLHNQSSLSSTETTQQTDFHVGLRSYFFQNLRHMAVARRHVDLDTLSDRSDNRIQQLIAILPLEFAISIENFQKNGTQARQQGIPQEIFEIEHEISGRGIHHVIGLLPKKRADWDIFDFTLKASIYEDRQRTQSVNVWNDNSCGPDVIIFAGMCSNAGIRRGDACSINAFFRLEHASTMLFRSILWCPWGSLTQKERDKLRTEYHNLVQQDLGIYAHKSRRVDVADLVLYSFHGLPSFSCTMTCSYICCDKKFRFNPSQPGVRKTEITIPFGPKERASGARINELVVRYFREWSEEYQTTRVEGCSTPKCKKNPNKIWVILDRIPPMLIVVMGGDGIVPLSVIQGSEPLELEYISKLNKRRKTYQMVGVIYLVKGHFVARWYFHKTQQYTHYDSLKKPALSVVNNFVMGLPEDSNVRIIFYREVAVE